ncbi:hypothetical protein ABT354_01380 [Streptomyces sp. NPDC000594]|uniref:hypothetical protein n=1 Tax=Streptomyces sp. NPDC000594 TaxID=3154261 RepID=UPI00332DE33B
MCFRRNSGSSHYICLPCRNAVKRRAAADHTVRCPRCARAMIDAGQDLAVPRRNDRAGWRALTAVLGAGLTFHSGCCDGPGWRPRRPREISERLTAAARTGVPVSVALAAQDPGKLAPQPPGPRARHGFPH